MTQTTTGTIEGDTGIESNSVSEALRKHFGLMRVKGTITSLTKLFKMIVSFKAYCDKCMKLNEVNLPQPVFSVNPEDRKCSSCRTTISGVNYEYCNVVIVELQDLETFNDLERLPVFLFDNDTENIRVGESITVEGQIQITESGSGKKLFPYFYADSIEYNKNNKVNLTDRDIAAIESFTSKRGSKILDYLVLMVDPSIIGNEHNKKGLLLCAVNSAADNQNSSRRERIHSLSIGPPGLGKSKLLRAATRLISNSRYESGGRNSSGKSLTAIVVKEEENYVLRLGPLPLAKNALCAIDEFGRTEYEDQTHFLNVMEEGEFTINKHGINATIKATTTIIASANPIGTFNDDDIIGIDQIPALKPIIDRFDLILVFKNIKSEQDIREYAYKKAEQEAKKVPDYSNYLIKHLEYARKFNPIVSDEAKSMISEFYNVVLQQYQQVVNIPSNPRDVTYGECLKILKETKIGITLEELFKQACQNNPYIERYLCFGDKRLRLRDNKRLRPVYEMLLNHTNVKRLQDKPVVLQWLCDPRAPCDREKIKVDVEEGNGVNNPSAVYSRIIMINSVIPRTYNNQQDQDILNSGAHRARRAHRTEDYPPKCYYCGEVFNGIGKKEYERHVTTKHKGKLCYPNKASLEENKIKPQGMYWE
jgi:replicative DNA helicase Mcm